MGTQNRIVNGHVGQRTRSVNVTGAKRNVLTTTTCEQRPDELVLLPPANIIVAHANPSQHKRLNALHRLLWNDGSHSSLHPRATTEKSAVCLGVIDGGAGALFG